MNGHRISSTEEWARDRRNVEVIRRAGYAICNYEGYRSERHFTPGHHFWRLTNRIVTSRTETSWSTGDTLVYVFENTELSLLPFHTDINVLDPEDPCYAETTTTTMSNNVGTVGELIQGLVVHMDRPYISITCMRPDQSAFVQKLLACFAVLRGPGPVTVSLHTCDGGVTWMNSEYGDALDTDCVEVIREGMYVGIQVSSKALRFLYESHGVHMSPNNYTVMIHSDEATYLAHNERDTRTHHFLTQESSTSGVNVMPLRSDMVFVKMCLLAYEDTRGVRLFSNVRVWHGRGAGPAVPLGLQQRVPLVYVTENIYYDKIALAVLEATAAPNCKAPAVKACGVSETALALGRLIVYTGGSWSTTEGVVCEVSPPDEAASVGLSNGRVHVRGDERFVTRQLALIRQRPIFRLTRDNVARVAAVCLKLAHVGDLVDCAFLECGQLRQTFVEALGIEPEPLLLTQQPQEPHTEDLLELDLARSVTERLPSLKHTGVFGYPSSKWIPFVMFMIAHRIYEPVCENQFALLSDMYTFIVARK